MKSNELQEKTHSRALRSSLDGERVANEVATLDKRPRILRLLIEIPESEAPFQQFSVPMMHRHDITLCTIFKSASHVPPPMKLIDGDYSVLGFLRALRNALRTNEYDIIHAHAPHVAFLYLLLTFWRPRLQAGTVMSVHNCFENFRFRNKLLLLPALLFFRRIVFCGDASYKSFPRILTWLARRRIRVVTNGVDTRRIDRVRANCNNTSSDNCFTVVSVCRLVEIKNLPVTLKSFASATDPSSRLVCVGGGPNLVELERLAQSAGIGDRVHFPGMLPREEVYRRVMASDLYISTSRGEGLPIAVLEAMCCGCPVVLSEIAPHREIAQAAEFIPLIPPDDVDGFAREIARFRDMTSGQRAEIGGKCQELVKRRFGLDAMLQGYESVFEELMEFGDARLGKPGLSADV